MVIGLSGKMGAGKDAVAALLAMRGFKRFAFADALRNEVEEAIIAKQIEGKVGEVWAKPTTPAMREILQNFGMKRREQLPGYWVSKVERMAATVKLAVISDVRFADEAEMVKSMGGEVWRIERPGAGEGRGANHVSESLAFKYDRLIANDGSMEKLADRVLEALARAERDRSLACEFDGMEAA